MSKPYDAAGVAVLGHSPHVVSLRTLWGIAAAAFGNPAWAGPIRSIGMRIDCGAEVNLRVIEERVDQQYDGAAKV